VGQLRNVPLLLAGVQQAPAATNLLGPEVALPQSLTPSGGSNPSSYPPSSWGIPAISPKVLKKIWEADFVDMTELLPGSWHSEEMDPLSKSLSGRPSVTEISVWMECFATLAALVSYRFPGKPLQLFAYCRTMASRNYDGLAWVAYDNAFWRQAATSRSYEWGSVDSVLYNEAFTGRARIKTRCHHCLLDTHTAEECMATLSGHRMV
jgi:hypothetical protein